jgi:hypothetical protein
MEEQLKAAQEQVLKLEADLHFEQEKNKALEASITQRDVEIADLEAKLAEAAKGTAPSVSSTLPTFKLEKVEYQFIVGGFNHEGVDYTAAEAAKDKTLLKELVEGGYGVITKL